MLPNDIILIKHDCTRLGRGILIFTVRKNVFNVKKKFLKKKFELAQYFHALGHVCKFVLRCKNLYRIGSVLVNFYNCSNSLFLSLQAQKWIQRQNFWIVFQISGQKIAKSQQWNWIVKHPKSRTDQDCPEPDQI